jgi:outer membrane autotransporter protein
MSIYDNDNPRCWGMVMRSALFLGLLSVAHTPAHAVSNESGSPVANLIVNDPTLGVLEQSVGVAIENLCPQLLGRDNTPVQQDLSVRCTEIVQRGAREDPTKDVLRQVTAEEVATQGRGAVELSGAQLAAVGARLTKLRLTDLGGGPVYAFNERTGRMKFDLNRGGSAGEEDFGRWSIYVNGDLATGDKDETENEAGFDFDIAQLTVGADYRVNNNTFVGVNLGYGSAEADLFNGGTLDTDGLALTLYGTLFRDQGWYLEGTLGLGESDYEQRRNLVYSTPGVGGAGTTTVNQVARGDTDGDQLFASVGGGKDFVKDDITATVSLHFSYLDIDIDGFKESVDNADPGFGMVVEVGDQSVESVRSILGGQISKAMSTQRGVVVPYVLAEWIHEFGNDARQVQARFVNDPFSAGFSQTNGQYPNGAPAVTPGGAPVSTVFFLPTDEPDENYFRVGGGLSAALAGGNQFFVALDALLGLRDISYYGLTIGYRREL